jgi:hypothetical protein
MREQSAPAVRYSQVGEASSEVVPANGSREQIAVTPWQRTCFVVDVILGRRGYEYGLRRRPRGEAIISRSVDDKIRPAWRCWERVNRVQPTLAFIVAGLFVLPALAATAQEIRDSMAGRFVVGPDGTPYFIMGNGLRGVFVDGPEGVASPVMGDGVGRVVR